MSAREPKPMDPERLAHLRQLYDGGWAIAADLIGELLADRAFFEAEFAEAASLRSEIVRLRARVRVEAEDVERAGVTWRHVEAWLVARGWAATWQAHGKCYRLRDDRTPKILIGDGSIARAIARIREKDKRPGLDILDEMAAAMEVPA